MLRAIIVDDEKSGRETLSFLLEKHFPGKVNVVAMAASVQEGVELIEKHVPALIFLDMEMPSEMGLSIVTKVKAVEFEIIVTTAHKEYGIDAIKAGVCDYILKPVDIDELEIAINKAQSRIMEKQEGRMLKSMITKVASLNAPRQKIPFLISNNKTIFVDASSIIRCEAEGNYTRLLFTSGKAELVTKLIKDVEELLSGTGFFRVHKSHLINIDHIKSFTKSEDDITMSDDSVVPLSRNIKADFLRIMNI